MAKKTNKKTSRKASVKVVRTADKVKKSRASAKTASDAAPQADVLEAGMAAPAFRLKSDDGGNVSLKDFAGRNLVLYFYPRANTPGCTLEAADFTRLASRFTSLDTAILGVSADPQATLQRFRTKHRLAIGLASDETLAMLKAYGVWGKKSFMGKTFDGILRTTVWIDPKGKIVQVWRNVKVSGHAEAVLDAIHAGLS